LRRIPGRKNIRHFENNKHLEDPRHISITEFDYPLPEGRIAQFPLERRDQSKLLVYKNGIVASDVFANLAKYLPEGSLVLFNETRVIHARLEFHKQSGSRIEVFCLEPAEPADIQMAFQQEGQCTWQCLVGNARRWKQEPLVMELDIEGEIVELRVEKGARLEETFLVSFSWSPSHFSFSHILEAFGKMPLPPYIGRDAEENDSIRYQTVYARNDGSVAAPTAGLHFTPEVLGSFTRKNIEIGKVTLHVGAGTFKPVSSATLEEHHMHVEQVIIPIEIIERLLNHQGKPISLVGTTTVRAVESLYWQGVKWLLQEPENPSLCVEQWDPYKPELNTGFSLEEALYCVYQVLLRHKSRYLKGTTSLLIAPGYQYRVPTAIITNFHQPKSTLLLLVSAFVGQGWRKAYDYALENDFRFLSYGDSCLFIKE
jgi:S-adenosylmethionine:tRNA ribosyltransferase-isomerase